MNTLPLSPTLTLVPGLVAAQTASTEPETLQETGTFHGPLLHRDPYTVSPEGNFVGSDGFVVPKNFAEFNEAFPRAVKQWVRSAYQRASEAEKEDRVSELNLFLMTLPEGSKFSEPGYNGLEAGCTDRIQTFSPEAFGVSGKRFFHWFNRLLFNQHIKLSKKAQGNPIQRFNTLSLFSQDADGQAIDDDFLFPLCNKYSTATQHYTVLNNGVFIDKFIAYVEKHNPECVAVMNAIATKDTYVDAQISLGMDEKMFIRARNRIVLLHHHFDLGTEPTRQRKVYRARTPSARPPSSVSTIRPVREYASALMVG